MTTHKQAPGPWRVEARGQRGFVAIRRYPYDGVAVKAEWLSADGKVSKSRHVFETADEARAAIASVSNTADPIVGHKTFSDGTGGYRHEPLRQSEANAYLAAAEAAQAKRAADMPTEEDAARTMWSAWQRLRELGWRETMYGPTGERVRTVSPGSAGIHIGSRHAPWPEKTWWIEDGGDLWPGNPCLFKPLA